jgi:hypothetical protein
VDSATLSRGGEENGIGECEEEEEEDEDCPDSMEEDVRRRARLICNENMHGTTGICADSFWTFTDPEPLQRIRGLRALCQLRRPLFRGSSRRQIRILLQQRTLVRELKGGQLQRAWYSLRA